MFDDLDTEKIITAVVIIFIGVFILGVFLPMFRNMGLKWFPPENGNGNGNGNGDTDSP
jgi:hypothetical protein